nr:LCP family protein [Nocardia farcinica]
MPVELGPGDSKEVKRGSLVGDDRHGHAQRPGGRAPWERYPAAETPDREGSRTSRRSRHLDAPDEGTPLTVQDLVEKVDSERVARRRRADPDAARTARREPGHAAEPRPAAPGPAPRATDLRAADPRAADPRATSAATPPRSADPRAASPATPPRSADPRAASPTTPPRSADPRAASPATPPRSADPRIAPPATAPGATDPRTAAPATPSRATDPRAASPAAPRQEAPSARRPAQPPTARPEPGRRSKSSPIVDDITGGQAAAPKPTSGRRHAEPVAPPEDAEEVTDIIPPVAEPEPARNAMGWPTTDDVADEPDKPAEPKAVPSPPLSRLAASRQRRTRRAKAFGRSAAALSAVLALLITGGGWSYLRSTGNDFTQVSALDENSEDIVDSDAQLGDENYLLVGTDTRAGANGQLGAGTLDDAEGSRADTTMLVHIPKARNRVVIVSFPRDLDVTRPKCNGWDGDKTYTKETFPPAIGDKLNAVYALGGPQCLVSTIQRLTGASINHFIAIDFAGFEAMVDKIDGVEVCATKPLVDDVLGTILEKPGKQRINGETALKYVRARHVYGEERSDYDRINRQQRFLASLLRGALSSNVFLDLGKLNGFIKEFTAHTMVDETTKPEDLLTLGRSLQKLDAGTVTFLTVPTAGTTAYGNEIPRESDIKAIFKAIRDDQPLPGEKPTTPADAPAPAAPTPSTYTAVDPSTVSLLVSNGSGYDGLARTAATKLDNHGFTIYNVSNYANGTSATTKVRYGAGLEAEAATVASAVPGATIEAADDLGGIVEVVVGTDSANGVTVQAPTPVGDVISNVATSTSVESAPAVLPADLEHVNAADEICK